jgi:hypothetical protein
MNEDLVKEVLLKHLELKRKQPSQSSLNSEVAFAFDIESQVRENRERLVRAEGGLVVLDPAASS